MLRNVVVRVQRTGGLGRTKHAARAVDLIGHAQPFPGHHVILGTDGHQRAGLLREARVRGARVLAGPDLAAVTVFGYRPIRRPRGHALSGRYHPLESIVRVF